MREIILNEQDWMVKGYWPWVPLKVSSMEIGQELMGVTDWLPATVPGGVHYDLLRAGLIEDPWFELNSWKCEWVENRWWVYKTRFNAPKIGTGKVELVFKGLDYEALIYLNKQFIGEHKGMYEEAVFDVTEAAGAGSEMELTVLFKHAPDEMSQIGMTSRTHTQKSRFNYKWDFSTRLVNIGIWDDVLLRVHEAAALDDVAVTTDAEIAGGTGYITVSAAARRTWAEQNTGKAAGNESSEQLSLNVIVTDPSGKTVAREQQRLEGYYHTSSLTIEIPEAKLWQPNGYGDQPLYQVQLQLIADGAVADERLVKTGIRSLSYISNEESPADALTYTFVVNGKRIYIRGVNMTPLDHLYGNVTAQQYEYYVLLMKRAGVNMVRVWGGGIIEKELFYDLCDRHGILVWQEFIQSSSGIDNIPSKDPEFLRLIERTALTALRAKRNHVSLTVWSGGNELMSEPNVPSTYEDSNLAMLKALVEQHDPKRLFLPTSASGPVQYVTSEKGVSHDVHGHWKYMGNPGHYELYTDVDNLFHSEFGVDGVSSVKSLRKFLSERELRPVAMEESLVWRHHGEWWDTYERDVALFGPMTDIGTFSRASQWIQAEGLRFVLEANRRRQFKNSGSIIWQLNEPFPNASSTSLVDYYGENKMAYYWTRSAFSPYQASAEYFKLNFQPGELFEASLYVNAHRATSDMKLISRLYDAKGSLLHEQTDLAAVDGDHAALAGRLSAAVTAEFGSWFLLRLELRDAAGKHLHSNDYFFSTLGERIYESTLTPNGAALTVSPEGIWEQAPDVAEHLSAVMKTYTITNSGRAVALHIRASETTNSYWMEADSNFFTLLPGESRKVTITCWTKQAGGFLLDDVGTHASEEPEIAFDLFA